MRTQGDSQAQDEILPCAVPLSALTDLPRVCSSASRVCGQGPGAKALEQESKLRLRIANHAVIACCSGTAALHARIAELVAEVEQLKAHAAETALAHEALRAEVSALRRENEALRAESARQRGVSVDSLEGTALPVAVGDVRPPLSEVLVALAQPRGASARDAAGARGDEPSASSASAHGVV